MLTIVAVLTYHADAELVWGLLAWIGASLVCGLLVDRPWFFLLPFLAVLLALPLGYPESDFEPLPTWYATFWAAVVASVAIVLARVLVKARANGHRRPHS